MSVQMVNVDGTLTLELPYEQMSVEQRMSKGEPTGVVARKYKMSLTATQLEAGKGFLSDIAGDGQQRLVKSVSLVVEDVNPEAVAAKRDARRFRTFVADVKWAAGLVKRKVEPTSSEQVDRARLSEWMAGRGKVFGREWDALPNETKDKLVDVAAQLAKRAEPKPAKLSDAATELVEVLKKGEKPSAELLAAVEASAKRVAKGQTAAAQGGGK